MFLTSNPVTSFLYFCFIFGFTPKGLQCSEKRTEVSFRLAHLARNAYDTASDLRRDPQVWDCRMAYRRDSDRYHAAITLIRYFDGKDSDPPHWSSFSEFQDWFDGKREIEKVVFDVPRKIA